MEKSTQELGWAPWEEVKLPEVRMQNGLFSVFQLFLYFPFFFFLSPFR